MSRRSGKDGLLASASAGEEKDGLCLARLTD